MAGELEVFFKDLTVQESDGYYSSMNELMDPSDFLETWVLSSSFGVTQDDVGSVGIGEFWKNKDFILKEYGSEFQTEYVPVDLIYLKAWLTDRGWNFVVDPFFRELMPEFWSMFDNLIKDDEMLLEDYFDEDDEFEEIEEVGYVRPQKEMVFTDIHEFKKLKIAYEKREEKEKRKF